MGLENNWLCKLFGGWEGGIVEKTFGFVNSLVVPGGKAPSPPGRIREHSESNLGSKWAPDGLQMASERRAGAPEILEKPKVFLGCLYFRPSAGQEQLDL